MKLTVFTPVYNRRDLLMNLYQSLEQQTVKDFVWLIVDDGSTDGCNFLVEELKKHASFPVKCIYQENQGKHVAHNTALSACKTELFVCVDSDDTLLPDAIFSILKVHEKNEHKKLLGYYFRKMDINGNISGGDFKLNTDKVGIRDLYHRYGFRGELVIVLRTFLINSFRFPVFQNEKFVSELVFYNDINNIAPMLWCDKVIYSYEYQPTGYSNNAKRLIVNNPYGSAYSYLSEAVYAYGLLARSKAYSEYLVMKKMFNIDVKKLPDKKVGILIKLFAYCFEHHYYKLFTEFKV